MRRFRRNYVLLEHFLGEIDQALEDRIAAYLRATQADHGGWSLYVGGDLNLSATVKAYYALKLIGDDPDAPHMARARAAILARGGAARCNVFTRISLALFGQVALARGAGDAGRDHAAAALVSVPPGQGVLLVARPHRPAHDPDGAQAPRAQSARHRHRGVVRHAARSTSAATSPIRPAPTGDASLLAFDRILRVAEPFFPRRTRQRAIRQAVAFITERLNGEDGLGAIFPPMAATVMVFDTLGYPKDHPDLVIAKRAVRKLVDRQRRSRLLPALRVAGVGHRAGLPCPDGERAPRARRRPSDARSTGLPSARSWMSSATGPGRGPACVPAAGRSSTGTTTIPTSTTPRRSCARCTAPTRERYRNAIERGVEWVLGMQCRNGGWGSFDADNTH